MNIITLWSARAEVRAAADSKSAVREERALPQARTESAAQQDSEDEHAKMSMRYWPATCTRHALDDGAHLVTSDNIVNAMKSSAAVQHGRVRANSRRNQVKARRLRRLSNAGSAPLAAYQYSITRPPPSCGERMYTGQDCCFSGRCLADAEASCAGELSPLRPTD